MGRAAAPCAQGAVGVEGMPIGQAKVDNKYLKETVRHNHFQNRESGGGDKDKDYGLSPARCKVYHNKQSTGGGCLPPPRWKSRINETQFDLKHDAEAAAKTMTMRSVKPDLVNQPQRGPIRSIGKGVTDAGIKFGNNMP